MILPNRQGTRSALQKISIFPDYLKLALFDLYSYMWIQMEFETTGHILLERMLHDATVEPTNLPISLLKSITSNFSDDRQIGRGGFAVVYKVSIIYSPTSRDLDQNSY